MDVPPDNQLSSAPETKNAEHSIAMPAQHFAKLSAAFCAALAAIRLLAANAIFVSSFYLAHMFDPFAIFPAIFISFLVLILPLHCQQSAIYREGTETVAVDFSTRKSWSKTPVLSAAIYLGSLALLMADLGICMYFDGSTLVTPILVLLVPLSAGPLLQYVYRVRSSHKTFANALADGTAEPDGVHFTICSVRVKTSKKPTPRLNSHTSEV